jgi:hypothetical protein
MVASEDRKRLEAIDRIRVRVHPNWIGGSALSRDDVADLLAAYDALAAAVALPDASEPLRWRPTAEARRGR